MQNMSSPPPLSPRPSADLKRQYYFAYGSNLQLKQMAKRCPGSKYIGRAYLPNYLWQINERGVANIVKSTGNWVEGLVYELNEGDEKKLDQNEGVAKEYYSKIHESPQLYRAPTVLYRRPVSWIVRKGGPASFLSDNLQRERSKEQAETIEHDVLVYISLRYITDGDPREEYIGRINLGVEDAMVLGMSEDYVQRFVRSYIPPARQAPTKSTLDRPQTGADVNKRCLESPIGVNRAKDAKGKRSWL